MQEVEWTSGGFGASRPSREHQATGSSDGPGLEALAFGDDPRGSQPFWRQLGELALPLSQREVNWMAKKPSKGELSKAGKDLRNPRTREKRETEAAKTLRSARKKKG
jgi:hypothetical protein